MHIPDKWNMGSLDKIHQFISEFGFATIISNDLEASHLPLISFPNEGSNGVLYGHFSKTNSHFKSINNSKVLVIFSGPHAYISPTSYDKKPAVPTWNYSAVHVSGIIEFTDDETTSSMLEALVSKYEPQLQSNNVIPDEFKDKLSKGITGFKITISQLEGKEKLGQHRSIEDQLGVTATLAKSVKTDEIELLKYMKSRNIGIGS